ncbi:MAG: sigma 54-interacting transcriptional regulator [Peptococcaceae bacterium]|jgi:propionate catabolism operon transcriptional regulator|nr:sigma 54-interacting transcriptional regulator [Peptococcaceae bacterium]MDH7525587.1 sigma 54-interacting transcriptional regulator [Peptococcaceae bacterium]
MRKVRIGCLTYGLLNNLTRDAIEKINDPDLEVTIFEGLMETLLAKVKQAYEDGIEVFVGGGANAAVVRAHQYPVVKIQLTAVDYIEAVLKAKAMGEKIAMVSYQKPIFCNLPKLKKITGVEAVPIVFRERAELEERLKAAGIDVVVGASLSNEIAESLHIPSILIYPGEETIISAIKEAKQMALALRKEKERTKTMEAILDFSQGGVIATDSSGCVIIYNPSAEKILGVNAGKVLGQPVSEVLPEISMDCSGGSVNPVIGAVENVNGIEIVVNKVPIEINSSVVGTVATFQKVSEIQKTEQAIRLLTKQKGFTAKATFANIIGKSKILREEVEKAKLYAKTNSNILIYGETGVGKELFAQSIHNYSARQNRPFVAINCAALPENLLESELFGYEEGAFTGSRKGGKTGLFEIAHEGTIFLDEIGEISRGLQARLLRVLQEKEVMKVGGDRVIPVDVRIIAATNIRIEDKIPHDFRDDLYYRLNVFHLTIPPLRQRKEDIVDLFMHFLKKYFNVKYFTDNIAECAGQVLTSYSWPGNIRELQNVAERFSLFFKNKSMDALNDDVIREMVISSIEEDRLFDDIVRQYNYRPDKKGKDLSPALVDKLESIFPRQKAKIAEKLGISRTTLWRSANIS